MTVKVTVDQNVNRLILFQICESSMYRDKQNIFLEVLEWYKKAFICFNDKNAQKKEF